MPPKKMTITHEVDPKDVANAAEVAQVFDIVFKALDKIKSDSDEGDIATRRELGARVLEMRKELNKLEKGGSSSIADIRKIIGSLTKWREMEKLRTTDADLSDALDVLDGHTASIKALQAAMKSLKLQHGKDGHIPDHEWNGTSIRFEQQDGTWGEWIDLRGPPGDGALPGTGAGMGGVRRIRAGSGVSITGDPGEPTISASGSSSTLITEQISGGYVSQSGNDVILDFTGLSHLPGSVLFVARQGQIQVPASGAPADGSSAVNITGVASARVYNADASETFLVGYAY